MLSYFQAIVIGLLQGVTELFPISSLGHSVLVPAWLGWDKLVSAQSADESLYLAFVVALHVATAIALLVYFRDDWRRIITEFFRTLRTRRVETPDERMAWLLVVATIPTGLTGLALEHTLRTLFAKPLAAAIFLMVNGVILYAGERAISRSAGSERGRRLDTLEFKEAGVVGVAQIGALFAGISRSGITMVTGSSVVSTTKTRQTTERARRTAGGNGSNQTGSPAVLCTGFAQAGEPGSMFWLRWKTLSGS